MLWDGWEVCEISDALSFEDGGIQGKVKNIHAIVVVCERRIFVEVHIVCKDRKTSSSLVKQDTPYICKRQRMRLMLTLCIIRTRKKLPHIDLRALSAHFRPVYTLDVRVELRSWEIRKVPTAMTLHDIWDDGRQLPGISTVGLLHLRFFSYHLLQKRPHFPADQVAELPKPVYKCRVTDSVWLIEHVVGMKGGIPAALPSMSSLIRSC